MRPEVVGAFRLAVKHEEAAALSPWRGREGRRRRWVAAQRRKHAEKAHKLYELARRLEARGIR